MLRPDGQRIQRVEDSFHYSLQQMRPFAPLRNIDGLSTSYTDIYSYAPRPTCSPSDLSCGGAPYLFCDRAAYRCAPLLRLGANCQRFAQSSPCYRGECCDGICRTECQRRVPTPATVAPPVAVNRVTEIQTPVVREEVTQRPPVPQVVTDVPVSRTAAPRPRIEVPDRPRQDSPEDNVIPDGTRAPPLAPTHAPFTIAQAPTHAPFTPAQAPTHSPEFLSQFHK